MTLIFKCTYKNYLRDSFTFSSSLQLNWQNFKLLHTRRVRHEGKRKRLEVTRKRKTRFATLHWETGERKINRK